MLDPSIISAVGAVVGFFVAVAMTDACNRCMHLNVYACLTPYASHM